MSSRSASPEIRGHRWHPATNVLVLHGTAAGRDVVARQFHAALVHPGRYLRFDCVQEEDRLRSAMRAWVAEDGCAPEPPVLFGDGRGTLFLDAIEHLSKDCQRLLLVFLKRVTEATVAGQPRPIGRLIAGSSTDLKSEVAAGRFLPHLYDVLNIGRIDLDRDDA